MNDRPCQHLIDWELMHDAEQFYRTYLESTYIETPWLVEPDVASITTTQKEIRTSFGQLVGSAEQGFLQLCKQKKIFNTDILYHSISPCFRDDELDDLHERHFMKLELFELLGPHSRDEKRLKEIITKIFGFFRGQKLDCEILETGDMMYDIVSRTQRIEVGSYGIRSYDFGNGFGGKRREVRWIYATGLALPRFTHALKLDRRD